MLLGISLAAPIGPINAAQIDKGIKNGFLHSWFIGLGSIVADITYMMVVYMGFVNFIDAPIIKIFLYAFGCFVLIWTGIESLLTAGRVYLNENKNDTSLLKTFMTGFLMALSNPLTILFWLGIYGSVLANTASKYNHEQLIIYSSAILLGLVLWDITMATIASTFRKVLTSKALKGISYISGLTLVGFGIYFGYKAISTLFF
ncbi:MAG: amino acid transporter [Bacillales bacterium]|jgi:threonine/homoserine/homoserine lactone efflux protein|nr:amino acid transporter [Bacillales bacterium]